MITEITTDLLVLGYAILLMGIVGKFTHLNRLRRDKTKTIMNTQVKRDIEYFHNSNKLTILKDKLNNKAYMDNAVNKLADIVIGGSK